MGPASASIEATGAAGRVARGMVAEMRGERSARVDYRGPWSPPGAVRCAPS